MVQMFKIIAVSLALVLVAEAQEEDVYQRTCLYSGRSGSGEKLCFSESYAVDLKDRNFDNKAYSFCATGVYMYYEFPNFHEEENGQPEYAFGPKEYCADFQNIGGRVSSVRFTGYPKNYTADSLTLCAGTYFQGAEEYVYAHRYRQVDLGPPGLQ